MRVRKRRVRLHLHDGNPSIEGVLTATVNGHYLLKAAKLLKSTDETISLDGDVEVPRRNVLLIQRIGSR
jgi:hypothetical protein